MGTILAAIENSAITEVDSGGMLWRVRKIASADLARVGHAALCMAQGLETNPEGEDEEEDEDTVQAKVAAASVDQLQTMAMLKDAVVAAGLMAVGDADGEDWEDVTVTLDRDASDASKGTIWVGSIPTTVSDELFGEIMSLSTDGGAALERLRSFREAAGNAPNPRSNRKKIRKAAK